MITIAVWTSGVIMRGFPRVACVGGRGLLDHKHEWCHASKNNINVSLVFGLVS
jgi:hypothetical protein